MKMRDIEENETITKIYLHLGELCALSKFLDKVCEDHPKIYDFVYKGDYIEVEFKDGSIFVFGLDSC